MALPTDKQIKAAIKALLVAGSGPSTRVIARHKLNIDPKDWKGSLRSLTSNDLIDGWIVTRTRRVSRKVAISKWEYTWVYTLWYFKSVRDNGANDNSEDDLNSLLENVAAQFENSPTLGFNNEGDGVDNHEELQVLNMDTVDDQVHIVQCELAVKLTNQHN